MACATARPGKNVINTSNLALRTNHHPHQRCQLPVHNHDKWITTGAFLLPCNTEGNERLSDLPVTNGGLITPAAWMTDGLHLLAGELHLRALSAAFVAEARYSVFSAPQIPPTRWRGTNLASSPAPLVSHAAMHRRCLMWVMSTETMLSSPSPLLLRSLPNWCAATADTGSPVI